MLMLAFGGLMVLLGLLSGGVLLATAAGWSNLQPGWTAWLAFPGLTMLGYGFFAAASGDALSAQLARAFGALCTLLAMAAGGESIPADCVKRMINGESPVRIYRELRGFTQAELGSRSRINRVMIAEIESGRKSGSIETIRKLADALSVTIDDLV